MRRSLALALAPAATIVHVVLPELGGAFAARHDSLRVDLR
jgi:hypothetical protein